MIHSQLFFSGINIQNYRISEWSPLNGPACTLFMSYIDRLFKIVYRIQYYEPLICKALYNVIGLLMKWLVFAKVLLVQSTFIEYSVFKLLFVVLHMLISVWITLCPTYVFFCWSVDVMHQSSALMFHGVRAAHPPSGHFMS